MKEAARTTMTKQDIVEYFQVYNTGDYKKAASLYYTEDVVFATPDKEFPGRDNVIAMLENIHRGGVKEIMHAKNMVAEGDQIAVEIEAEFTFPEDAPDFILRPAKKGESIITKFGVFYKIREGRIARITLYQGEIR
jgi:ketosteroid isomerase-like protein